MTKTILKQAVKTVAENISSTTNNFENFSKSLEDNFGESFVAKSILEEQTKKEDSNVSKKHEYINKIDWRLPNGKLHREDGPATEWVNGSKEWRINGILHREDGPAIEYANGYKEWRIHGELHREDGPAIEYADGSKEWYLNGEYLSEEESEEKICNNEMYDMPDCHQDEDGEIEVEIRKNPTLQEIREKTENFSIFEKGPGLLYRKYDYRNFDENYELLLNSKLVQRVRWILRDIKEELIFATEEEVHSLLIKHIRQAYDEYADFDINEEEDWLFETKTMSRKKDSTHYNILLRIKNSGFLEFISFDLIVSDNDVSYERPIEP